MRLLFPPKRHPLRGPAGSGSLVHAPQGAVVRIKGRGVNGPERSKARREPAAGEARGGRGGCCSPRGPRAQASCSCLGSGWVPWGLPRMGRRPGQRPRGGPPLPAPIMNRQLLRAAEGEGVGAAAMRTRVSSHKTGGRGPDPRSPHQDHWLSARRVCGRTRPGPRGRSGTHARDKTAGRPGQSQRRYQDGRCQDFSGNGS